MYKPKKRDSSGKNGGGKIVEIFQKSGLKKRSYKHPRKCSELFHILSTGCSQENVNKRRKNFNWYLTFYG